MPTLELILRPKFTRRGSPKPRHGFEFLILRERIGRDYRKKLVTAELRKSGSVSRIVYDAARFAAREVIRSSERNADGIPDAVVKTRP